jgi:hypothetical protein
MMIENMVGKVMVNILITSSRNHPVVIIIILKTNIIIIIIIIIIIKIPYETGLVGARHMTRQPFCRELRKNYGDRVWQSYDSFELHQVGIQKCVHSLKQTELAPQTPYVPAGEITQIDADRKLDRRNVHRHSKLFAKACKGKIEYQPLVNVSDKAC